MSNFNHGRMETHPLFNPVILERIFQFLQVHNLKNVRLICKQWNKISSPFLQSKSEVVLIRGKELDKRRYSYKNFIKYIESLSQEEIFFRNYHIEHWILNEKREKSLLTFWQKCGLSMKELHLRDIIFYETETIRNVLYNWTPQLETLFIEDCLFYTITQENIPLQCKAYWNPEDFDEEYVFFDYYDHVTVEQLKKIDKDSCVLCNPSFKKLTYDQLEDEAFPLSWEEVFLAYPNMQKLEIASSIPPDEISTMLSNLGNLRLEQISFFKTRSCKGTARLADLHLQQLCPLNTTLTTLEMVLNKDITSNALEKVISRHKDGLKTLTLYFDGDKKQETNSENSDLPTPMILSTAVLSRLTTLNISLQFLEETPYSKFLEKFPNLRIFKLWSSVDEFQWETLIDHIFLEDLRLKNEKCFLKLDTFSCGYLINTSDPIHWLSSCFPSLKILEVPLNDNQIRIVFQNLKLLEEIVVYDRHLTDAGITGDPLVLSEFEEWNPTIQRKHAYIGDLKRLKKFTLRYWRYEEITDSSIYHGLIDVVNLSHLHLTKTGISDTALNILACKLNLVTLISPTHSGPGYIQSVANLLHVLKCTSTYTVVFDSKK